MSKKQNKEKLLLSDLNNMVELGKIPPQAIDMEEAVLGAMLLESHCIDMVLSILKPESFYKNEHQHIFRTIKELRMESKPIDLLTVTERLRKTGKLDEVGGPYYVTILTSKIASAAHVEMHARIVQDKFILRELIRISTEIQSQVFNDTEDSLDIISNFQSHVNNLLSENQVENAEHIQNLLEKRVRELQKIAKNKAQLIGVPSGLTNLDRSTGGWQKTDLIIIAGRPSMGKTAFALFSALQSSYYDFPVAFFSLEMSKAQLIDRALSVMTTLSPLTIRTGRIDWQELEMGIEKLENLPFFIDDTPALTLTQLRAKVMQLMKFKIKLIVIDYLQLMNTQGEGDTRDQAIGYISRGLKALAKEVNIPVMALSQLNRAAEGHRPKLSNLRESGNIEQDSDVVVFIHRPEKYGSLTDENGKSTKGLVELIIDKHRNGPTGLIKCWTNEYCSRFVDNETELSINSKANLQNFYEVDGDTEITIMNATPF